MIEDMTDEERRLYMEEQAHDSEQAETAYEELLQRRAETRRLLWPEKAPADGQKERE